MKRFLSVALAFALMLTFYIMPAGNIFNAKAAVTSTTLDPDNIVVTNNAIGTADKVVVYGLYSGDVIRVYSDENCTRLLGKVTTSSSLYATLNITQIGTTHGDIYVTVTSTGCTESGATPAAYDAEPVSDALTADDITVTNNGKGVSDTVYVEGLNSGDIVYVYTTAGVANKNTLTTTGGRLLKSGSASGNTATLKIGQIDTAATTASTAYNDSDAVGCVWVSRKSTNCLESSRVEADFTAEDQTPELTTNEVTVTNNPRGTSDTVYVASLTARDIVKVYDSAENGKLLGSATAGSTGSAVTIKMAQLGSTDGDVWVTLTNYGYLESDRLDVPYAAEQQTTNPTNIIVTNNAVGTSDTVYVQNLAPKDVVKVYTAQTGGTLLGTATVASSGSDATVKIAQLGISSGVVYVSVTSTGMAASNRVPASYNSESGSTAPTLANITVTNNPTGTADTVYVKGLLAGDIVKVYDSDVNTVGEKLLGTATVASSATDATVTITQLVTASNTVYISVTSTGKAESLTRTSVPYDSDDTIRSVKPTDITIANNADGTADTVHVGGLLANDVVKVYKYASGGTVIGTATVASGNTYAIVSIDQLGTAAGTVYVSVTTTNKAESLFATSSYLKEGTSTDYFTLTNNTITATNNIAGAADTVYVTGLKEGDIINVYNVATGGTAIGTATVAAGATYVTVSIAQITTGTGYIYVSCITTTTDGVKLQESARLSATYSADVTTTALTAEQISITNNSGIADTVKVTGAVTATIVTKTTTTAVTDSTGNVVTTTSTTTSTTPNVTKSDGTITVGTTVISTPVTSTVTSTAATGFTAGTTTSSTSATTYTTAPLTSGDIVNVYDAAVNGNLLGTATVSSYGTSATVSIDQLGTNGGTVYVTLTNKNKAESARFTIAFSAEIASTAPASGNVTITNNAGASDTIGITGLSSNDVVTVYKEATGTTVLGTGTVGASASTITITIAQLGTAAGNVYITVTSTNQAEGARVTCPYSAETQTSILAPTQVSVLNNYLSTSTVTVTGLKEKDVINVYSALSGGTLLGTGTVATNDTQVVIDVSNLITGGGDLYVTVTSTDDSESPRLKYTYDEKAITATPSDVTIVNNAGTADTVTVKGVSSGTIIDVYDAVTGGNLLGTVTVGSTSTTGIVTISQLPTTTLEVWVTATSTGKRESTRYPGTYVAEPQSTALSTGDITIVNNSGASDTITINGLSSGDIVNYYTASGNANNTKAVGTVTQTVTATGSAKTVLTIPQLSATAGIAYLTVTTSGKAESLVTAANYVAESVAPNSDNNITVAIVNNAGIDDTITVSTGTASKGQGLLAGDVVNLYSAETGGTLLATGTVTSDGGSVTISYSQLSSAAGTAYLTLKNVGCAESKVVGVTYIAEAVTTVLDEKVFTVANNTYNAGTSSTYDTITIDDTTIGDTIYLYSDKACTTLLGRVTVVSGTTPTITVEQLGQSAGYFYAEVKSTNKLISAVTTVHYTKES